MSFQDVGRPGTRPPQRRTQPKQARGGYSSAPSSGNAGAFSSAAAGGSAGMGGAAGIQSGIGGSGTAGSSGGYEQVSDSIVQYQRNVALLEKMSRTVGTKNDTSVTQTQYNLQIEVINQLGQRIENQLRSQESRLTALPRNEASSLRTTHVKLTRDYRLVEQQFKNVQLDVKRKRGLAEARQREAARMEEEEKERKRRAGGAGGEDMTEEGMRWQMQIQEDKINEEIMREREEEIRNIHKGMHTVNEIYKDLAHLVDTQQEGVDQIETQMENTKENTATGLKHIEKANESSQSQCVIS
mmetsp:Transcript_28097/g.67685  ORF Transcript_28097/g.67685 Transcript_28097/m.67685 type:complete len:298 (+) Transcript_28097:117-1010(+)|eukprot:CAMPEP_0181107630 /NCGR_PEP_ID=MMETSP1071-20121207/17190_1 /TAXON_ID=35127 /ORGANISM="Thalassiosira sp., Strain NH16" /LENGTH=297 /DNA_ID=CAMNT_0023191161 /DNA_START=124 /DNA_END=1020 /DNA_ORIENTATION=+